MKITKKISRFINRIMPVKLMLFLRSVMSYIVYPMNKFGLTPKSISIKKKIVRNIELASDFKVALSQMANTKPSQASYFIDSYKAKSVETIRMSKFISSYEGEYPILLCYVKNDLIRIKAHIDYYRRIGIKYFAYVDNMSTDGTFEFLNNQEDVSLFRTNEQYMLTAKGGIGGIIGRSWLRQISDIMGYDKWYLNVDADEFFIYPGIENKPINKYVNFLERNNIESAFAPMLDMYPRERLFIGSSGNDGFMKDYCYFDTDTYIIQTVKTHRWVRGGPRRRLSKHFGGLSKYPLNKLSKDKVLGVHLNYPIKTNFECAFPIGFLLHYKIMDYSLYNETNIMQVEKKSNIESCYYNGSKKLNSSMDLMNVNIIDKSFFDKFLSDI